MAAVVVAETAIMLMLNADAVAESNLSVYAADQKSDLLVPLRTYWNPSIESD